MIIKAFEFNKNLKIKNKIFLFYGENQGQINEIIETKFKNDNNSVFNYDESNVLSEVNEFTNNIFTKSFFEKEKLIIIKRCTDKIKNLIEEIAERDLEDIKIILISNTLEKKSKLRTFFEKEKKVVCTPFYEDNNQTLQNIALNFFRERKISISYEIINLIINRSRGDRLSLQNELQKIQNFSKNKKEKIEMNEILKITNLAKNYDISELADNCLARNKKKTITILNENNYSSEDCMIVLRTLLAKSKRLLKLKENLKKENNVDNVISAFKPPIFWKDKNIVKEQINRWNSQNVEDLIYRLNETGILIKKNSISSLNILSNFIIEECSEINN